MMQGTWSCTYHGPKGTQASTLTVTSQNANWVLITSKDGAYGTTPAHESATLVGYDSKKGQYVGFGGNTLPGGGWGVGIAKASPTATSFTVVSAYPPDPTHDKTTYTFTATLWNWIRQLDRKGQAHDGPRELHKAVAVLAAALLGGAAAPPSHAMVVTAQHDATQVGVDVLRAGGNAVDAAVAVGYALAVTDPCCGNIGGGGFMLIRLHDGRERFIDFRETAPQRATSSMYLDAHGNVRPERRRRAGSRSACRERSPDWRRRGASSERCRARS